MGQVTLSVNNRHYEVRCDDGQEAHLYRLADYVNAKVGELAGGAGQVGEARLLLMASLLIADELMEARAGAQSAGGEGENLPEDNESLDETVGNHLESLADRLEIIAERLKHS